MIDERTVNLVLDRANIADVVGDFLTLHRKGKDFVALCPFHDDRTPSMHISTSKNICKCFVCNEGGTPVSFLMKHQHFSFPEAIKYLGRKYGIEVVDKELTPEQMERKSAREKLLNANSYARDQFVNAMLQGSEGRRIGLGYFRERGLTDEIIKEFELGYSPSEWTYLVDRANEDGIDLATLDELGLIFKTKKGDYVDRYRERVIFPIHNTSGNVVGFGGRILKKVDNVGKYINSPSSDLYDKSNELYGLYFAKRYISKEDKCLVLEGYMDVLSMYQCGVKNVVASSGTALTDNQVLHIKRLTSNVTLLFDADGAGIKAALRGLDVCLQKDIKVSVLLLPEGEDPDSFAQTHSLDDVNAYIKNHEEDGLFFKKRMLLKEHGASPQAQATIIEELAQSIAYIPNQITKELYIGAISEQMEITQVALSDRVEQIRENRDKEVRREQFRSEQRSRVVQDESLTNLSTKASTQLAPSKVAYPNVRSPFDPYEHILVYDLMDYGTTFFPNYVTSAGRVGVNGIEIINDITRDLREMNEGLSKTFLSVLDQLLQEQEQNPNLDVGQFLTSRDNDAILYFAERYLLDKYNLSTIHARYIEEMAQEEEITRLLMRDVLSLKLHKIEKKIAEVHSKINSVDAEDPDKIRPLLMELVELNKSKSEASKLLGDRVITPKGLLGID